MNTVAFAAIAMALVGSSAAAPPAAPSPTPAAPPPAASPAAPAMAIDRFTLANGIRGIAIESPGALKQTVLTFLPLRLAGDPGGHGQWSHLAEHLLLRSVVAEGFMVDGARFNGETRANSQHLETIGDAAKLDAMADLHAKWLATRTVAQDVLEREKTAIAGEESSTAQRGFDSKFAIAAWNQEVRQGMEKPRVHGDVADATRDGAEAWLRAIAPIGPEILVATIGPLPVAKARASLERALGAVKAPGDGANAALQAATPRPVKPGETIDATWDLPRKHVMVWWEVPGTTLADLVRSQVVGTLLHMQVTSDPALRGSDMLALIHPVLPSPSIGGVAGIPSARPETTTLLVDVSLKPDDARDPAAIARQVQGAVSRLFAGLGQKGLADQWRSRAVLTAFSMPAPPFRESQRRGGGAAMGEILETQWLLTNAIAEYEFGATRDEIGAAADAVDLASVRALVEKLDQTAPSVLVLKPGA